MVSLKVDPEVAARAEGALASLAGIAAVAEEGTGLDDAAKREAPAAAAQMHMPPGYPGHAALLRHAPQPRRGGGGGGGGGDALPAVSVSADWPAGRRDQPPPMNPFPPCPPGVDPMLYARSTWARRRRRGCLRVRRGSPRLRRGGGRVVSKFCRVLQGAVQHQQETFARVGAASTSAERRAEAIARFLKKRKERNFEKKVRHASRRGWRRRGRESGVSLSGSRRARRWMTTTSTRLRRKQGSGGDDVSHEGEDGSGGGEQQRGSGSGSKENSAPDPSRLHPGRGLEERPGRNLYHQRGDTVVIVSRTAVCTYYPVTCHHGFSFHSELY